MFYYENRLNEMNKDILMIKKKLILDDLLI